ncbi:MAG: LysM peptidoglycan-binding domain-containing protein [Elusimicrobia bacterium]|jgi:hypothetical protein|nr:LysM peptidoglycan-binding domain-containing protein [Elusimicrobiota bacterium]
MYKNSIKIIILVLLFSRLSVFTDAAEEISAPVKLLEIEVKAGDTLSKFAQRYLNDPQRWPELLEYNKIPSGDPNLLLPGDKLQVPAGMVKEQIADIIYMKNNVRKRRSGAGSWSEAELYERMYPEDGIRTADKSFAKIQYLKGGAANIGENALVFLRPESDRQEVIKLEVGELRAKDVKVLTDSASIDPDDNSEYTAKVDEDKKSTLSVFKGKVDFISSGQKVTVDEGFMSVAELNKPPSAPMQLPDPPEFKDYPGGNGKEKEGIPADIITSNTFNPAELTKKLSSKNKNNDGIRSIYVQVARDKEFTRFVIDREIKDSTKEKINEKLHDGEYWWRAAFVNDMGTRSGFSEPVLLKVDSKPPALKIIHPVPGQEVRTSIVSVKGVTERYAVVKINDETVTVDKEGNFVIALNVKFGENKIKVTSTDNQDRTTVKEFSIKGLPVEKAGNKTDTFVVIGIISSILSIAAIVIAVIR